MANNRIHIMIFGASCIYLNINNNVPLYDTALKALGYYVDKLIRV